MGQGFRQISGGCLVLVVLATTMSATCGSCLADRIPEVDGLSLTNQPVALPKMLRGKVGVLIVGFSRGSRDSVAGWGRRLADDYRDSPTVIYYEMPMLASVPGMVRGVVVRSMRSSVPERAQARFVPITSNEAAWRAVVRYGQPDDAYLLVVDGRGDIAWQTQGKPTDAAYASLKKRVEGLRGEIVP